MDGCSAALRRVRVSFDGAHLVIQNLDDGDLITRWPTDDVSIDALHESGVLRLTSRSGADAVLTLPSADALPGLRQLGLQSGAPPTATMHRLAFAGACVGAIGALVALIWITVPALSRAIAQRIPLEVEHSLAAGFEERLAPAYCGSEAASRALAELREKLLPEDPGLPPVHILNLSLPNAFAFPGGTIVLTRGLVESAEGPDEVAGVLAHELQHVLQRHLMAGMVRGTLLSALWAVSVGDFTGLMVIDPSTAFQIATLQFSREDEAAADRGAVTMLERAGIRRDGLKRFLERLEKEAGAIPEWLSTHPTPKSRARATGPEGDPAQATRPALGDAAWKVLQEACSDSPDPELRLIDILF